MAARESLLDMGRRAAGATLSLLLYMGVVLPAPAVAQQHTPTCFGEEATIVGTDERDVLEGTNGDDVIVGGKGRDFIHGKGGDDLICGGRNPLGSKYGDPLAEELRGGGGADRISGGRGRDFIVGGGGDDFLRGDEDVDSIFGSEGRDVVLGNGGWDRLNGHTGADLVRGGRGRDLIDEDRGRNVLAGGAGDDTITGGVDADRIGGGRGRDIVAGGEGRDNLDGGRGRDVVTYVWHHHATSASSHSSRVVVDLRRGIGTAFGRDSLRLIEDVWSGGGSDLLVGNSRANVFYVGSANKEGAEDVVRGGGGRDTLSFDSGVKEGSSCSGAVTIDLGLGGGTWANGCNDFVAELDVTSIERVIGSNEADILRGSGRGDDLFGLMGDDELYGKAGRDHLDGGKDDDFLDGGRGTDHCVNGESQVRCE